MSAGSGPGGRGGAAAWAVWAGLLTITAAVLGLALATGRPHPEAPGGVPVALGVLAVFQAVLADLLHRQGGRAPPRSRARPDAGDGPPATPSLAVRLAPWVLDAALAGHALLLARLGFPPATWGGFGAVAAVLLLLHRPREDLEGIG